MIESAPNGDLMRSTVELGTAEAMRLLASAPIGRIVFSRKALPAIRPVNHLVVDGRLIVRTRLESPLTSAVWLASSMVVAYEADELDPVRRLGWSVVITGLARTVTDPARIAEYERRLQPWVDSAMDSVIEIEPSIVSGIRLIEKEGRQSAAGSQRLSADHDDAGGRAHVVGEGGVDDLVVGGE